jgi:hypothetical protein
VRHLLLLAVCRGDLSSATLFATSVLRLRIRHGLILQVVAAQRGGRNVPVRATRP